MVAEIWRERSDERYEKWAEQARASFNDRFWFEEGGYLYDVVDVNNGTEDDSSLRPNQFLPSR